MDDVVLSVGASIAERAMTGSKTKVVTVFAGLSPPVLSEYASKVHASCGLADDGVRQRIHEDLAAVRTVGGEPVHLPFLDAIYRKASSGAWLYPDGRALFTARPEKEAALVNSIYLSLAERFGAERFGAERFGETSGIQLATCGGLGGHIDHLVTRDAVLLLGARLGLPVVLWEDLPYGVDRAREIPEGLLHASPRPVRSYPSSVAWMLKWRAIECYRSQLAKTWPAGQDWREEMSRHAIRRGGGGAAELLWRVTIASKNQG